MIHHTAIIDKDSKISEDVEIGPYCVIGSEVEIASNSKLHIWGGGGITNDSNPTAEYNESITKVKILMDALESAKTS